MRVFEKNASVIQHIQEGSTFSTHARLNYHSIYFDNAGVTEKVSKT